MENCYIDFLNSKNGFKEERKWFSGPNAFEDAVSWGKLNLENFHIDMVKYTKTKNDQQSADNEK